MNVSRNLHFVVHKLRSYGEKEQADQRWSQISVANCTLHSILFREKNSHTIMLKLNNHHNPITFWTNFEQTKKRTGQKQWWINDSFLFKLLKNQEVINEDINDNKMLLLENENIIWTQELFQLRIMIELLHFTTNFHTIREQTKTQ